MPEALAPRLVNLRVFEIAHKQRVASASSAATTMTPAPVAKEWLMPQVDASPSGVGQWHPPRADRHAERDQCGIDLRDRERVGRVGCVRGCRDGRKGFRHADFSQSASDPVQRRPPSSCRLYEGPGFVETFRTPGEGEPIHVDLALDGYKVGIAAGDSTRDDHGLDPITTGQRAAVILWTDDAAEAFAQLTSAGCLTLEPPHQWLGRLTPMATPCRSSRISELLGMVALAGP